MDKDTCSYHQTRPAVRRCGACSRHFCTDCVTLIEGGPADPRCVLCDAYLEYLGGGNAAQPFWAVAHRFFAYPLAGSALGFLLVEAVLMSLVGLFGLLGLLVFLFAAAVGVKYCFAVLESVAMGGTRPPSLSEAVAGDEDHLFLKFIALLIAIAFVQAVADIVISPVLGMLVAVLTTLVMPAMIILLAVDRRLGDALSPGKLSTLMFSIGWPYLLAVFLTNVISTGPYLVAMLFGEALQSSLLALPLLTAVTAYFAVVNFALLGYMVYEHQGSLGYVAGDPDDERLPDTPDNRRKQLLGEVNVLLKEGRQADALQRLDARGSDFAEDLTFHQRHFELATQCRDAAAVSRAAGPYLELLMTREGVDRALDVWRQATRVAAPYRPANPAICHTLAEHAYSANLTNEALGLLINLHKRAPDYQELEGAYALAAKILREQGDAAKAAQLEDFIGKFLARRNQPPEPGGLSLTPLQ